MALFVYIGYFLFYDKSKKLCNEVISLHSKKYRAIKKNGVSPAASPSETPFFNLVYLLHLNLPSRLRKQNYMKYPKDVDRFQKSKLLKSNKLSNNSDLIS